MTIFRRAVRGVLTWLMDRELRRSWTSTWRSVFMRSPWQSRQVVMPVTQRTHIACLKDDFAEVRLSRHDPAAREVFRLSCAIK